MTGNREEIMYKICSYLKKDGFGMKDVSFITSLPIESIETIWEEL